MTQDPKPSRTHELIQKGLSRLFAEKPAEKAPELPKDPPGRPAATLAAVAQARIQFLDNAGRPLYGLPSRGTSPLSRDEEQIARSRSLEAIREAQAAGRILGKPSAGGYLGRDPSEVMAQVASEDLKAFLAFVLANPRSFMQRPLRISEAFLAWLVDRGEP